VNDWCPFRSSQDWHFWVVGTVLGIKALIALIQTTPLKFDLKTDLEHVVIIPVSRIFGILFSMATHGITPLVKS